MYQIATVAVENTTVHFDKEYSYLIPETLWNTCQKGCRVTVPFGRGNRRRTGIVLDVKNAASREHLKPISAVLDSPPLLNDEGLYLLRFLKSTTFCTWFDALRLLIPAGVAIAYKYFYSLSEPLPCSPADEKEQKIVEFLQARSNPAEEGALCDALQIPPRDATLTKLVQQGIVIKTEEHKQRILDEKICMVRISEDWAPTTLTTKQKKAYTFLQSAQTASLKEVCYYAGVTRVVVDALAKKGAVEYYDRIFLRNPYTDIQTDERPAPVLTEAQQAAFTKLSTQVSKGGTALLYGVTGSGKTEVFLKLISHVLEMGRQVIVMVPEIALTAQTVDTFHKRFGARVAVLHSGLSMGERMDEWRRIQKGGADIVVGTRSAVFAPVQNLGLIVMDEEQEHTYKSDQSPRFHARDIARVRCSYNQAMLLLASATPSIESYYHAKKGQYNLVTLDQRFNRSHLPEVVIVDMREAQNLSGSPSLSSVLLEELRYNLEQGEQSILLLNRRGYSTLVQCPSCGSAAECPHCSVALTYHAANDNLLCHYCGYSSEKLAKCGHCGSSLLRFAGMGTQKLEEELTKLFPSARILRVDMDTTMRKFSHEKLFASFANREYDIMIGTQMVAKGLNFPAVSLVGVLCVDQSLYAGDFRSYERSFALLTQVVGRSGRAEIPGRAFIQTYSPDHPIIQLAATQNYPTFYSEEIMSRKLHLYPPFCTMAGIGFVGVQLEQVQIWANRFLEQFRKVAASSYPQLPIRVLGPVPADIVKAAGKYRYKLLIKCRNDRQTRALLQEILLWFHEQCKTVTVFIDMYYDRI